jgi:prephenate dehydrogenase
VKRILVIGCGLLGTSIALALAGRKTKYVLYGADVNPDHIAQAIRTNAFRQVFDAKVIPDANFDVVILAVPVRAAYTYLDRAFELGSVVIDICSVKTSICEAAKLSGNQERFAPTHPMAGKAVEGPEGAEETLFSGHPWLYIKGWPAVEHILPIIIDTGAVPIGIDTPDLHDHAMAIVSHSIHLVSLSAMTAYGREANQSELSHAGLSGPAFRDITRLAASPIGFWVETLMENQSEVLAHLDKVTDVLTDFKEKLRLQDEAGLTQLLEEARDYHQVWRGGRDSWHLR